MSKWEAKRYDIVRKATEDVYTNKEGVEKTPYRNVGEMVRMKNTETGEAFYKVTMNTSPIQYDVFAKDRNKKASQAAGAAPAASAGGYGGNSPDITQPAAQANSLENEFVEQEVPVINYPEADYPEMGEDIQV